MSWYHAPTTVQLAQLDQSANAFTLFGNATAANSATIVQL